MRLINRHCSDGVLCSPGGHRRIVWRTACFLAVATAALLSVACGGDDPVEPPTPVPSEVAVSPSEGPIPTELARLQNLRTLSVSANNLTGGSRHPTSCTVWSRRLEEPTWT